MKNLILLTVLTFFTLTPVIAQVSFGAKAGVNFSDITGPDVDSFTGRTGLFFGAIAEIDICESWALQPELLYSSQGSDYEDPGDTGTAKVDYINLPIIAKYYVADGLSIEAGPQFGFLTSAKFEFDGGEEDFKDDLKSIDFGVNFGLGYKLDNGLNFSARYNLGLTDANDSEDLDGGAEYKNSVIQVGVGFFF
ncbi:MAG: PorT family protein [Winogradskyella sp.]|uniref:porin family protein n=1 Tax=Winogradskyella sp. TaxID=1883156 RepID=UPI0017914FBF|nr:PorT family protein [Winogradskyella sp.]NNE33544.1 PorT family protein [Winogradskyella sp.]